MSVAGSTPPKQPRSTAAPTTASTARGTAGGSTPEPGLMETWPRQATDAIVQGIDTVADKTRGPAVTISRGLIYGLFAAIIAISVVVLLCIAVVRVITVYMPGNRVWPAYLILGGLFLLVAAILWARAKREPGSAVVTE